MASTVWKGYLSFGLVSIPLRLYAAARSGRIELHQLHKQCRTRLRRPLFCPTCNRMVEQSEVVKGYEYEKGQYLLVEDQEIKKLAPMRGEAMEISEFVPPGGDRSAVLRRFLFRSAGKGGAEALPSARRDHEGFRQSGPGQGGDAPKGIRGGDTAT